MFYVHAQRLGKTFTFGRLCHVIPVAYLWMINSCILFGLRETATPERPRLALSSPVVAICTKCFNILKILHSVHRVYLCVSYDSHDTHSSFL
jgi:hypothetical protein